MLRLAEDAGLNHGYLENQVFATRRPTRQRDYLAAGRAGAGRPYLARAAEEHSGPHGPWFWQGERQGGGVLSDMMCHSVEVAPLPAHAARRAARRLTPISANATVATLKWTRPSMSPGCESNGADVDYAAAPGGGLRPRDPDPH